jgi:competence ComEA-like helix-hairpin-helix protein
VSGLLSTHVTKEFASKGPIMSKNMDLNTATEQELTVIQGIGKDNAKKIVQHRLQNGSFKTWEDLRRIPGLPPHLSDMLKRSGFTVGGQAA